MGALNHPTRHCQRGSSRPTIATNRHRKPLADRRAPVLNDDDVTPMAFVLQLLESVLDNGRETATLLMLGFDRRSGSGRGVIWPAALRQMPGRSWFAGKQNHPLPCLLRCVVER
jgi:ATP-dependent Clp protease adapter protein ClpS